MKSKIRNKYITVALCVLGLIGAIFLLAIGIKKDIVMLEAICLFGLAVVLLIINKPAWLIYLQLFYCCINKFLISQLHISSASNYVTDALTLLIFAYAILIYCSHIKKLGISLPIIFACSLLIVGTISAMAHQVDLLLLVWSYRNIFRFFLFFFSCVVLLEEEDIYNLLKMFTGFFWANVLVVSFQRWVQGYYQDNLGGLFGTDMGCNGYMNTFLCMYLAYIAVSYIAKKMSFIYFMAVSAGSLYIAALSELKFVFMEYVIILFLCVLLSRANKRVLLMALGAVVGLFVGIQLFNMLFPGWEFSLEQILDYAGKGGYSTENDLNRLTALQEITQQFFVNPADLLFGFGMGSCETSSFFNSKFFLQYGDLLHYTYLSHAFMLLENGWVGLILYLGFFVSIFGISRKYQKTFEEKDTVLFIVGEIAAIISILHMIYNNTLRVENSGYIAFFFLAIPFIYRKSKEN